jgi:hypothetical protein
MKGNSVVLCHKSAMTPQLLNDEQYNIKTASAATRRHLPQLLNDEQHNMSRR